MRNTENHFERLDWTGKIESFQLLRLSQLLHMQYPLVKSTQKQIHILLKASVFHCEPELVSNLTKKDTNKTVTQISVRDLAHLSIIFTSCAFILIECALTKRITNASWQKGMSLILQDGHSFLLFTCLLHKVQDQ